MSESLAGKIAGYIATAMVTAILSYLGVPKGCARTGGAVAGEVVSHQVDKPVSLSNHPSDTEWNRHAPTTVAVVPTPQPRRTFEPPPDTRRAPVYAPRSTTFWALSFGAYPGRQAAEAAAAQLRDHGFRTGVLWIPDYSSLSGKQFWMAYVGPIDYSDRDEAEAQLTRLRRYQSGAYGIKVDNSGSREEIR